MSGRRLVVVPCGRAKLTRPAPAGELYVGGQHLLARQAADRLLVELQGVELMILSALHGLVALDRMLAPYDVTIVDDDAIGTFDLAAQLQDVDHIVALTPNGYTRLLLDAAAVGRLGLPRTRVVPVLAGCRGIGDQRGRLAGIRRDGLAYLRELGVAA